MKLLLTSAGITNPSIHDALVGLLDKPIDESSALCIPTAGYGHPWVSPVRASAFISGREPENPMAGLGWRSVGVLELTALPTIARERWTGWVAEADVLLVNGGDAMYLAYWMRQSGLAELLPTLRDKVWVGLSAGSMVMTPRVGAEFLSWDPPLTPGDETLGVVDFSICPHLAEPGAPGNTMAAAEKWASGIGGPAYAIDDRTAIRVVDGTVDVVSEGNWKFFPGGS
ncbi:Type 1 glutamine amidotransferase-like domain-containing protein [Microbacterium sp. CFBP9034]|uniref:Type 1 glutamine amidotransferase-like domain-containing protein n=1 Tax=Microbacterium sp. CFBP9034 TaxID=3096540 RepID=UPI002A699154|nr:Type 1 glutamine amidotransferase-like domain-containing protein [Microbacterium sp. CFBP9034]MDY0908296.1 Type 1 glutamine amidotransferase-like domain-containing protein [Microbacterium sp. CFBP9034]